MTERKGIPFVDLVAPHVELEMELLEAIQGILRSGAFVGGPVVESFERSFAEFCQVKECVGVSSGTDALRFALMAAGVGAGDGVITVANTFAATVEAIVQAKATPHFVDIHEDTYNMDPAALRIYLETQCNRSGDAGLPVHRDSGQAIRAIIPVHLFGQMCDMDPILAIAEEYGLIVIEDACQAHGAEYFSLRERYWRRAGSMGNAAAFSFYPGKNLGACGEGGAVTTNDKALADRIRMLRDHGQSKKYHHAIEGYNGRLHAMQAAILNVKLPYLEKWNIERRAATRIYNQLLEPVDDIKTPAESTEWSRAVYHLYVIRVQERDALQRHLTKANIATGLHYPIPLHLQPAYANVGFKACDLHVTERCAQEILSLPIFPQITRSQLAEVSETLRQFYKPKVVARVMTA